MSETAKTDFSDTLIFADDGQPLVEIARAGGVDSDGQPLPEWREGGGGIHAREWLAARATEIAGVADIDGFDELDALRLDGGGRTIGAGQVTEILERTAEDGVGIIDVLEVRVADGDSGFVFGETMYF